MDSSLTGSFKIAVIDKKSKIISLKQNHFRRIIQLDFHFIPIIICMLIKYIYILIIFIVNVTEPVCLFDFETKLIDKINLYAPQS